MRPMLAVDCRADRQASLPIIERTCNETMTEPGFPLLLNLRPPTTLERMEPHQRVDVGRATRWTSSRHWRSALVSLKPASRSARCGTHRRKLAANRGVIPDWRLAV